VTWVVVYDLSSHFGDSFVTYSYVTCQMATICGATYISSLLQKRPRGYVVKLFMKELCATTGERQREQERDRVSCFIYKNYERSQVKPYLANSALKLACGLSCIKAMEVGWSGTLSSGVRALFIDTLLTWYI